MRRLLTILFTITLLAAACGDDGGDIDAAVSNSGSSDADANGANGATGDGDSDSGDSDSGDSDSGDTNFSGAGSGDFCAAARQIDEDFQNQSSADMFSADGIARLENLYRSVIDMAPDEIRGDFETALGGFLEMASVVRDNGGDLFAAGEALETLDTTAMDTAGERIEVYLSDVCGIDSGDFDDDFDTSDLPDVSIPDIDFDGSDAEIIQQLFGVDADTAECLLAEFGGTAIDPGALTGGEICGMSVFELVEGMTG